VTGRPFSGTLVLGATGFVGRQLVAGLADHGRAPRILVQDPCRAAPAAAHADGVVVGDLLDPNSLEPAVRGVRAIFYLVHSMDAPAGGDFAAGRRSGAEVAARSIPVISGRPEARQLVTHEPR